MRRQPAAEAKLRQAAALQNVKIAVFGGIYNNYLALDAAIADAKRRGCDELYCLGDLGAFGPHPDRVFPLLVEHHVATMQGNYDNSIGNGLKDCQCGYTDPRDNYFAKLSYDYTYAHTSPQWKRWMKALPKEIRLECGGQRVLMVHGSPRKMNEFLWESTTPTHFLEKLCDDYEADVILATHTGIHWKRELSGGRLFVNVGVLGRPENDGRTNVWYTIIETNGASRNSTNPPHLDPLPRRGEEMTKESHSDEQHFSPSPLGGEGRVRGGVAVEFVPVQYDHARLAHEMKQDGICDEFIETIRTGWWTTCLEILPAKERKRGRF